MTTKVVLDKQAVGTDSGISKKSHELLSNTPVWKALMAFAIPSVIGMTIQGSYTFFDKLIVANFVGTGANSGLLIAEQLVNMILGLGLLIGVGAGAYYGICLGKKDQEKVRSVISTSIITGAIFGIIAAFIILVGYESLMTMMGSESQQIKYAGDYLKIVAIGFPLFITGTILMNFLRTEGKNKVAAITIICSAILNIVIDLILIVGFGMGIEGAAIATLIGGYATTVIVPIIYAIKVKETNLKFNWLNRANFNKVVLWTIILIGVPTFLRSISGTISQMIGSGVFASLETAGHDWSLVEDGVNKWQWVLAAALPSSVILILPIIGVIQAQTPIMAYSIGANKPERIREVYIKATIVMGVYSTLIAVVFWFWGGAFLGLFGVPGSFNVYTRNMYVGIIAVVMIYQVSSYYQITKKTLRAVLIGVTRNLFIFVPVLLFMSRDNDPTSAFNTYLITDGIALVISGAFFFRIIHKLKKGII